MMPTFDPVQSSIEGSHLIEASAGTGKTWTITALYLRLLIEKKLSVDKILVVTFTRAATAELRTRIRQRIENIKNIALNDFIEDPLFNSLLMNMDLAQRHQVVSRLSDALRNFDGAAIDTIHGFCQKCLGDFSFRSGMPFETVLVENDTLLRVAAIDDFWRKCVSTAPSIILRWLAEKNEGPEQWGKIIGPCLDQPYINLDSPSLPVDLESCLDEYAELFTSVQALWNRDRGYIVNILKSAALNNNSYSQEIRDRLILICDQMFSEDIGFPHSDEWRKLTPVYLASKTRVKHNPPSHPFFSAVENWCDCYELVFPVWRAKMLARMVDEVRQEMRRVKREKGIKSFSDCLQDFDDVLQGPFGDDLACLVRNRYHAALIDEFQDTDPVQYRIFQRLFKKEKLPLYFVGDPKQAIYSFRGADIFTYLQAREEIELIHSLNINYRSVPEYVEAVNILFQHIPNPFYFSGIDYQFVQATDNHAPLVIDGDLPGALRVFMLKKDDLSHLTVEEATSLTLSMTVREITRLLALAEQGKAKIGDKILAAGDIVILVGTHFQAAKIRQALLQAGIPSAQQGRENVYETNEAVYLQTILKAVVHPTDVRVVRAALSTPVLGYSAKAIANLAQDEQVFEEILEGFYLDHQVWRERGFMPAFERIMQRFDVDYRMLAQSGGERSLTNLRHLAQLLQLRSDKTGQTGAELLSWFIRQQKGEGEKEALLQLESDANLIQIATVHASKGLEYPIVFCPFLWAGNGRSSSYPVYHNENDAIVMDFGTEKLELARQRAEEERYSESIRYLYVALTRASYRTYFSWGWINQVEESPLSWILYSDQSTLKKHLSSIRSFDAQDIAAPLVSLQGEYPDLICLLEDPGFFLAPKSNIDLQSLAPRIFKGRIVEARKVASYTSLTYGYQDRFERLEHEETSPFVDSFLSQPVTECNIFSFPRGVIAGNCLHELLEKLDFTQDNQIDGLVEFILKRYGFDRQWNKVISATLRNVLEVEVIPGVQLNKIGLSHKCPELPFCFPMARISVFGLIQTLKKMHGVTPELLKQATGLSFLALQGFMKGFMDLVYESGGRYYLVDYKSNWLGNQVSDYSYDQLEVAMTRHAYGVQFMIYCVALNRYLSQRLCNYDFDQHFGGVQYLFLRGLMPGLDTGIYRVRPERGMIEQLDCYFRNGDSK